MRMQGSLAGLSLIGILSIAMPVLSQTAPASRALIVAGQTGQAPVIKVSGRSYVDVEALARLTNGSLSFKGNQITLTLPASAATAQDPSTSHSPSSTFSKEFLNMGIETMAVIREWRSALVSAVRNGYPVTEASVAGYRAQAIKNLKLSYVAASTDADRSGYQLLNNELDNMQKFSDKILATYKDMRNITPESLNDDPLYQQISNCARAMVAMATSGQFQDDASCH